MARFFAWSIWEKYDFLYMVFFKLEMEMVFCLFVWAPQNEEAPKSQ